MADLSAQDRAADARYKKAYGKSLAWYNEQLAKQGGVCAVCGRPPKKNRLAVDHNHRQPNIIRGLLCMLCNRKILGCIEQFRICPSWIISYLEAYDPENPLLKGEGWQIDVGKPVRKKKGK
jgi:Recombination endonuclease VII